MPKTITTVGGRTRVLPEHVEPDHVAGLDDEGRIVVDQFGARTAAPHMTAFMFGLTLCCNAFDKGVEDGIVCHGCYDNGDVGRYLYRADDGSFPGLDPIA